MGKRAIHGDPPRCGNDSNCWFLYIRSWTVSNINRGSAGPTLCGVLTRLILARSVQDSHLAHQAGATLYAFCGNLGGARVRYWR